MTNRCRLSLPLSSLHLGGVSGKLPPRTNNVASTASSLNARFSSSSAARRTVFDHDCRRDDGWSGFNMPVILSKVCLRRATKGWNPLPLSSLSLSRPVGNPGNVSPSRPIVSFYAIHAPRLQLTAKIPTSSLQCEKKEVFIIFYFKSLCRIDLAL